MGRLSSRGKVHELLAFEPTETIAQKEFVAMATDAEAKYHQCDDGLLLYVVILALQPQL